MCFHLDQFIISHDMHHDHGTWRDDATGTTLKSLELPNLPSYLAWKFGQNVGLEREIPGRRECGSEGGKEFGRERA